MRISYSPFAILAAAFSLGGHVSAFVVNVYDSLDCTGPGREVNVWDNTCALWMAEFRSFRPTVYGGMHQYGWAFSKTEDCSGSDGWRLGWVDGGDGRFLTDLCYHFDGLWYDDFASWYNISDG